MPENITINDLSMSTNILPSVTLVGIKLHYGTSVRRELCGVILLELTHSTGYE
jgi:hypothetical protein